MPNPRYYPQQREQKPTARDQTLAGLNAPEQQSGMDPGALMQMLSHLYGIQQGQAETGLHQQDLALKQKALEQEGQFHTAQLQEQGGRLDPSWDLLPEPAKSVYLNSHIPGLSDKIAQDAASKNATRWSLSEAQARQQPDTPANHAMNMGLWGPENADWLGTLHQPPPNSNLRPGQQINQTVRQLPGKALDAAGKFGGFMDDILGDPMQKLYHALTAPSQANPTPPPVYKPVQFMPQERPLRTGF